MIGDQEPDFRYRGSKGSANMKTLGLPRTWFLLPEASVAKIPATVHITHALWAWGGAVAQPGWMPGQLYCGDGQAAPTVGCRGLACPGHALESLSSDSKPAVDAAGSHRDSSAPTEDWLLGPRQGG